MISPERKDFFRFTMVQTDNEQKGVVGLNEGYEADLPFPLSPLRHKPLRSYLSTSGSTR